MVVSSYKNGFDVVTVSEVGGHAANEDAFATIPHPRSDGVLLCALADGQGGQPGGAEASRLACSAALDAATKYRISRLFRPRTWPKILKEADRTVTESQSAGSTTLVALCVSGKLVVGASSGDSTAILFSEGRPFLLTANQRKNPPVGSGLAEFVTFRSTLQHGWSLWLMSDGVWKYVGWDGVNAAIGGGEINEGIDRLKTAASIDEDGKLRDDFTVVAVKLRG